MFTVQFTITQNIPGGSKLDRNMVNHSVAALIRKCLSHKVNANGSYWWNCFATKNFAPCSTNINDNDKRKGVIDIFNQTKHILNNMTGWSVLKLFPKLFCCKKCFLYYSPQELSNGRELFDILVYASCCQLPCNADNWLIVCQVNYLLCHRLRHLWWSHF